MFTVGVLAGYIAAVQITGRSEAEIIRGLILSHAALKTTECTMLLKGIHEGKQDLVTDRLKILLNFALIDLAREYSPSRDHYGSAAKALGLAREYRAAHPYKDSLDSVAREVEAALAIKTAPAQE
jgi:hypothetical protein